MASEASRLVTPEAVVLDLPLAGIGSRGLALLVDVLLQGLLLIVLSFSVGAFDLGRFGWIGVALVFVLLFAILFAYPVAFETALRGRTPGKALVGLRVVTLEGGPVRFRHAAVRAALGVVDFHLSMGGIAVVSAFANRRGQRLGDIAAGTVVVRERAGAGVVRPLRFRGPPGTEVLQRRLDVGGMDEDDYEAVRSLLVRADALAAPRREALAEEVAQALADRVVPARPAAVPPTVFLTCVAAAYQERHAVTGRRQVTDWIWAEDEPGRR